MKQQIPYQKVYNQILALLPDGEVEFLKEDIIPAIEKYNQGKINNLEYKNFIVNSPILYLQEFYMPAPLISFIELTNKCNLDCRHCYADSKFKRHNEMSTEMIFKLLDELDDMGALQIFLTGGEIFVHKDAIKIIQYAATKKYIVQVFTNGLLLNEKIVSQIPKNVGFAISFDTAEPSRTVRGKMNYPKLKKCFELLDKYGLAYRTAMSIHKYNVEDVFETFQWCLDNKYPRPQWSETFPTGRALKNKDILLQAEDIERVFIEYQKCMDIFCATEPIKSKANENEDKLSGIQSIKTFHMVVGLEEATRRPKRATTMVYINSSGEVFPSSSCVENRLFRGGSLYDTTFEDIWNNGFSEVRKITIDDFKSCKNCPINLAGIHCNFRDNGLSYNVSDGDIIKCGATDYIKLMIMKTHLYWENKREQGYKLQLTV